MSAVATSPYLRDQKFFSAMALGIAAFILFAFAQFSARGMVDFHSEPIWPYLHGISYLAWLGLLVAQSQLVKRGSLPLHRRLGWATVILAIVMVVSGWYITVWDIELHRQPPFFNAPYFLALSVFDITGFGVLVAAAVVKRREMPWHSRLMLGATVILMEPALGRLVPPSFFMTPLPLEWLGTYGNLCQRLVQLGVLGIAMVYDKRTRGAVHPALIWTAAVLIVGYQIIILAQHFPPLVAYANHLAGA